MGAAIATNCYVDSKTIGKTICATDAQYYKSTTECPLMNVCSAGAINEQGGAYVCGAGKVTDDAKTDVCTGKCTDALCCKTRKDKKIIKIQRNEILSNPFFSTFSFVWFS